MRKKTLSLITLLLVLFTQFYSVNEVHAAGTASDLNVLKDVEIGSFNEFGHKITKEFFKLKDVFEVDRIVDETAATNILDLATKGYNYLPDDLENEANFNALKTALRKGIKFPSNDSYYRAITQKLELFVNKSNISTITGKMQATPSSGNAPLVTTLRSELTDPSGSTIPSSNYIWYLRDGNKKVIIGKKPTLSYTFREEGIFSVYLDVKSTHKNKKGYPDVLPFSGEIKVQVKEKIASIIVRIGSRNIPSNDEIKFSPEEASYGLIFDATSSVPTTGSKFLRTTWDFGNGVKKSYSGSPRMERVIYAREGNYDAILTLKTNQGQTITRKFTVMVHKPIAKIKPSQSEGFMGDKFSFRAVPYGNTTNLSYEWEIIDLSADEVIERKVGNIISYIFKKKGRYGIKLKIKDAAGNIDADSIDLYINSRAPIPSFTTTIPKLNKPNEVYFDATQTFDPDFSDDGNLKYSWTIDGDKVNLERPNFNGSTGFYTFDTIGEHSIVLEVEDPDQITAIAKRQAKVNSTLAVDFQTFPRVINREGFIRFVANSPEAKFYEWDFGDGEKKGGDDDIIKHSYKRSGIFNVKLTVRGKDNNSNSYTRQVYVGDSQNPLAVIGVGGNQGGEYIKEKGVCGGKDAYIVDRTSNIVLSSNESINTDGNATGLSYAWKLGNDKYFTTSTLNYKFDELDCVPIKLTVKSIAEKTTDSEEIWIKVQNIKPTLSSLKVSAIDINADPVIVNVSAVGAKDKDGVIQSYLWYYTTDGDNEPQDFRITKLPQTSFVLPKIPGSYYFSVVLKDNNEEKVNSEDIVGRNSISLTGDNANTPLIDFSVNDSSVAIGDEVIFKADAQNILGKSVEKTAKFSWDFDGDGFYEKETDEGSVSHKYKSSGEFHPKVKVKNKGFSNTRSLTVNVSNKLVSDFSYISIGNKYVFLDKSKGKIDNTTWVLGDGNKVQNKTNFVHNYTDRQSIHDVELTVAEGTKTKKSSQIVKRDVKNILKARKDGINVFSHPEVDSEGNIVLEEEESVFMYIGESKGDFSYFAIDYDIDSDSDINGGKDDDIDNLNDASYKNGDPQTITLNTSREQTLRLFLLDENGTIVDSKDITIIKSYIEQQEVIDPNNIVFEGVSDSVKVKIEELKSMITNLPQEHRLKGMKFIQTLQEEWSDETQKTRTIIEFEGFLDETGYEKSDDIINLLESLLVEGEDDKSEKNIAFKALKALIPETIVCETSELSCKESLLLKLEDINNSGNTEQNRATGKEILEVIAKDNTMSAKQKNDFKAVLKVLVYSGVNNIPESELQEQKQADSQIEPEDEDSGDNTLMTFLKKIGFWAAILVGVIFVLMFIAWLYSFLKNRKSGESFEDFVEGQTEEVDDILGDMGEEKSTQNIAADNSDSTTNTKIFSDNSQEKLKEEVIESIDPLGLEDKQKTPTLESSSEKSADINGEDTNEQIPDWLSGNQDPIEENTIEENSDLDATTKEEKTEENKTDTLDFSDDITSDKNTIDETKEHTNEAKTEEEKIEESFNLETDTKISDDTPDWLKDSLTDELPKREKVESEITEEKIEPEKAPSEEETVIIEDDIPSSLDLENDVPDWLKDSVDTDNSEKKQSTDLNDETDESAGFDDFNKETKNAAKEQKSTKIEEIKEAPTKKSDDNIPDWLKDSLDESKNEPKGDSFLDEELAKAHKEIAEEEVKAPKAPVKKASTKKPKQKNKTAKSKTPSDIKESKQEEKKDEKTKPTTDKKEPSNQNKPDTKETKKGNKKDELWDDGMKIPDWLKND